MNDPHTINRGLVIIIPKKPFYDWENEVFPDDSTKMSTQTIIEHNSYLLKSNILYDNPKKALKNYWEFIFEDQLIGVCTDEETWPLKISWKLFTAWFDFHFSSIVIDLENSIIEKEEY
jgi:hypothetical protein